MSQEIQDSIEGVEQQPLVAFTEKAYLDYSMYVIMDRALPHLGDGLKPVQRRIVYAMSELGLKATAKYKKSARTVGDVLGKFHPHGDSACYEAMVLMAQPFSYRYPLVDGQGNWGSPDDPKSFAAMRYTESRLAPYAEILLKELGQGTVDWLPNFDGTLKEPAIFPARLPNILLNGTTGIAVGMATDIPPHNSKEVADACIHLLENPKATVAELCEFVQGPDFPTTAEIITPKKDLLQLYEKGQGSVRARATYLVEEGEIVITALPHQVSGAKVLEQIAAQMQAKKLPMLVDLRDESDHENPTRLVLVPRSNRIDIDGVMKHLFATTDLERSYRVNMNVIGLDGRPQVKSLQKLLNEWLTFRTDTVKHRLQYRLEKVLTRLHVLDGLLIAFLNIDEVIHIIRHEDDPKAVLMQRFQLSDKQAEAILELKLRHLAKLEEQRIRAEQQALAEERDGIEKTLSSERRLKTLVRKEISEAAEQAGDARRSPIVEREEAKAISADAILPSEPVTVVLSEKGWVRAAKGHEVEVDKLNYKAGDHYLASAPGRSNQPAIFLDSTGRSYTLMAHTLPSARGQGEPITGRLTPPPGASFCQVLIDGNESRYLMATDAGYGFVVPFEELHTKNRTGKAIVKIPNGAALLKAQKIIQTDQDLLAAVTSAGHLLVFPISQLPEMPRGKGNKIINIPAAKVSNREEILISTAVLTPEQSLKVLSGKRHLTLKPNDLAHYHGERARRGLKLPRGYQKVDGLEVVEK